MPSKVDIANDAFRLLGASRITDFTQGTKNANVVSDIYDDVRQEMLQHPWNFASSRVELARLAAAPAFGFSFAYALPSDWIYTVSVHDNSGGIGSTVFREEIQDDQNVLLAEASNLFIRYTFDLTDPNRMSAKFRKALSAALARDMAIAITNSNTLEDKLDTKARKLLSRAKSSDAIQSFPLARPRGSWANSRNGRTIPNSFNITGS